MHIPACLRSGLAIAAAALSLPACGSDNEKLKTDADYERRAVLEVKAFIQDNLDEFAAATAALQAAAPEPDEDGWSASSDKAAVDAMKAEWKKARQSYERVEGAIAVVFPDLDYSTDARYDAFIEVAADDDLFDDEGVTGVHAVERILWADEIPEPVLAFESALMNYSAAAFPATEAEAAAFKGELCERLKADAEKMKADFEGLALDAPSAYRGVINSILEQVEKTSKAATGEEESRYAQYTLADMRANVAAGEQTYAAFQPWLLTKGAEGAEVDQAVLAGFDRLSSAYDAIEGDALPPLPEGWSEEAPTEEQLATPFGELFALVERESDDATPGTLAYDMTRSADLLGIPALP
ncbi:EfeM/EfeO family lipoprotein [Sorangium sp. So ce861]|uniref:EfeM/EfeO family lipoprotein n=1 Tax=Sorangium sp. So ce861 TaxID=3133323 RepID=UPI003F606067